jgi:XTP/dITP diphosphohydrolase
MTDQQRDNQALLELLIATGNPGKRREFAYLLADVPLRLRTLAEFPHVSEVEETGTTFAANAVLKAQAYCRETGLWTLADDSGLEVAALDGAPGVHSARYAGAGTSDEARRQKLLLELARIGDATRRARFVCVIALARPAESNLQLFTGVCEGHIAHAARGEHGFGYDPLFVPDGYAETFGELSDETKQHISHRARALAAAKAYLLAQTSSGA